MAKFASGKYTVKNPAKYAGNKTPMYRSSWEWAFMQFCDNHPGVIQWASEAIKIPYKKITKAHPNALIMHPGPMNRGVEIDTTLADDINRSIIKEQVEMGVAVRMACLKIICGNKK